MDLKQAFATNESKENDGVWHDLGEGAKIKVARVGNESYNKEFEKVRKPYRHLIARGSLSQEVADKLLISVLAKTILLDWKGIQDNGKEVKYSVAEAKNILTEYKDFRELVVNLATEMAHFKDEADEIIEKNS